MAKTQRENHSVYSSSSFYLSHRAPRRCAALPLWGYRPSHCRPRPQAPVRRSPGPGCCPGLGAGEGPPYPPPPLLARSPRPFAWEVGWEGVEATPRRSNTWDPTAWWPHHPNTRQSHMTLNQSINGSERKKENGRSCLLILAWMCVFSLWACEWFLLWGTPSDAGYCRAQVYLQWTET